MKQDTQLTQQERYQISILLKAGYSQSEIARIMNRHKSTISREIRRNSGLRGYRPQQVQRLTEERRQAKVQARIPHSLWQQVERLLRDDWSPEQISLWLKAEYTVSISHEWI
jgi:IS30 family transposase